MTKKIARLRRATKTREHIKRMGFESGTARMTVHRSTNEIYVQVLAPFGGDVIVSASSIEKDLRNAVKSEETKTDVAKRVGQLIAQRAIEAGIMSVACDRSGFRYIGRIAALVQSARDNGLNV